MAKKKNNKNAKSKEKNKQPKVSVCTPTFNRRPFFTGAIKCINAQTYPRHLIEWIIVDDGSDKIEDLIKDIDIVKYFKFDEKMKLGKKRNFMHDQCTGDIIVYFDDDDYYPPERISHAVNMLLTHKKALCAGSSELNLYFNTLKKIYKFGPYGESHATAGTFAFKKELLKTSRYDDEAALAEERHFLKDYTVPFVQLESKKTILVISHSQNTFDKKMLLPNADKKGSNVVSTNLEISELIKDEELLKFYSVDIHEKLNNYDLGNPNMKPDVIKQTNEILQKIADENNNSNSNNNDTTTITFKNNKIIAVSGNKEQEISNEQVFSILQKLQNEKSELLKKLNEKSSDDDKKEDNKPDLATLFN